MEKKKRNILVLTVLLIGIIAIIGVSYALWVLNLTQTGQNDIVSSCFNITFTDKNNISLQKAYPILDAEGKKLTPYEFTITNTCDSYASFNVNLEVLNTTTLTNNDAIKAMISSKIGDTETEITTSLLSSYQTITKTLDNAQTAFNLTTGYLNAKESKTYTLRLWLDENVGMNTEGVQNTKFSSKVVVTTSYIEEIPVAGKDVLSYVKENADSSSTDVITVPGISNDSCTYTLAYDGTSDNNLRYVGKNPCNYVTFNGEKAGWRIIGILNTPEGQRMKLIRTDSIGSYSWDNKASGTGSSISEYGSNDWTDSTLKEVLNNGAYYNKTSGTCSSVQDETSCDFTSNGLTEEAKNQIDTITWKLGGTEDYQSSSNGLASHWYTYERGTTVYTGRPTEWPGKVGLMYPSDYGYATSGGSTSNRTSCLNKELYNWADAIDCTDNDWLYDSSNKQWTLAPETSFSDSVFYVEYTGYVVVSGGGPNGYANSHYAVRPSVYLIPSTSILGGEGTLENPYEIG
uniref:hypothetical protein n=2 Tax=Candidatus Ventrenecus sp. TaxID=3085654 RepID=UPI0040276679